MAISDEAIAMTFTSANCTSIALDGMLMDGTTAAAGLREAKRRTKVKEITLRSVTIDASVAHAANDLFSDSRRVWEKVDLVHCTGRISQIVKTCVCRTKHFSFTGSVPIAHNPRYSLDEECMEVIGRALKTCKALTTLSLKGSRLDRESLEGFCKGLARSESLETLQLSHCAINIPDVFVLSSALKKNQNLRALSMAHCKIGEKPLSDESNTELCRLLESIVSHPALEVLNIYGMYCSDRAIDALGNLLRAPRSKLWRLGLKNNSRHPDDKVPATNIFEAMSVNSALTYLQISGNNVDDNDIVDLARILGDSNMTLRVLNLTANNIGDRGVDALARKLPEMKGLQMLDLQRNSFSESAKQTIIAALKDNFELERLDLDGRYDATKAYYICLNKGGRRLLQSGNAIPPGLWPLVLARCNRLPFNRSQPFAHVDILYTLLHGPAIFQLMETKIPRDEGVQGAPPRKKRRQE